MTGADVLAILRNVRRPGWLPLSYVMAHVQIESSFNPAAVGSDGMGSLGLMQVEPATAKQMGGGNQLDALTSLQTGITYITWLHGYLTGKGLHCTDYAATVAEAYNEGPGNRALGYRDPDYETKWRIAQATWGHADD